MSNDLNFTLEVFEGPLDLLLHLIEKNKIDIYDIPIAKITDQYMEYIKDVENAGMDIASEFLLMAATLLDIKSRMLLPGTYDEEEGAIDPRTELVEKLLEYKMYKYMSLELRDRQMDSDIMWFRQKNIPKELETYEPEVDYDELTRDITLAGLFEIYKDLLKRQEYKIDPIRSNFGEIKRDEVNMEAKVLYIKSYIKSHGRFSFRQLLEKQNSKAEIIVTFLVILEEMKQGEIKITQEETFGEIMIESTIAA